MPQCKDCRWHHNLEAVNDRTEWKQCLALPYPQCLSFTHMKTECPVPKLFKPAVQGEYKNEERKISLVAVNRNT